jgi:hypothetical protein
MIEDKDIIFITTTLYSKWLNYSQTFIKKYFPESEIMLIDGRNNWPYAWFYWMEKIKESKCKWFVHIDEDCFLTGRQELVNLISKMETEDITLSAVSDGYHHYRGANPVAINSFFMVGNIKHINDLNFTLEGLNFWLEPSGWKNNKGIIYDEAKHKKYFVYPHEITSGENYDYEQEPYYMFLWMLKESERKFYYLYPHFDERFKSTNPRIDKDSNDIAIHMWYTRSWNTPMDVWGMPNNQRYEAIENHIMKDLNI